MVLACASLVDVDGVISNTVVEPLTAATAKVHLSPEPDVGKNVLVSFSVEYAVAGELTPNIE